MYSRVETTCLFRLSVATNAKADTASLKAGRYTVVCERTDIRQYETCTPVNVKNVPRFVVVADFELPLR